MRSCLWLHNARDCFSTVLFAKILNRNDEKSKFWFAPCSEKEYQEELEVDEEEGMDLDSSDATGG